MYHDYGCQGYKKQDIYRIFPRPIPYSSFVEIKYVSIKDIIYITPQNCKYFNTRLQFNFLHLQWLFPDYHALYNTIQYRRKNAVDTDMCKMHKTHNLRMLSKNKQDHNIISVLLDTVNWLLTVRLYIGSIFYNQDLAELTQPIISAHPLSFFQTSRKFTHPDWKYFFSG